jgi:antirestriction protein ArdC
MWGSRRKVDAVLKADNRAIFTAASSAQKAADYLPKLAAALKQRYE